MKLALLLKQYQSAQNREIILSINHPIMMIDKEVQSVILSFLFYQLIELESSCSSGFFLRLPVRFYLLIIIL